MIGKNYWAVGITIRQLDALRWIATVEFFDDGFAEGGSTEGLLRSRYAGPLDTVVDLVRRDAKELGIEFRWTPVSSPRVFVPSEDDASIFEKEAANGQAKRLGWDIAYPRYRDVGRVDQPGWVRR